MMQLVSDAGTQTGPKGELGVPNSHQMEPASEPWQPKMFRDSFLSGPKIQPKMEYKCTNMQPK